MRTVIEKIDLFTFNEASEALKSKILTNYYDINVDHEWCDFTYEDANNIGVNITSFCLDRGSYCEIEFKHDAISTAESIIGEHGEACETYKTAKLFLSEVGTISNAIYGNYEDIEKEFKRSLSEDYRIMLAKEYEYLTSEEAITEALICNEYEFTEEGKIY